MPDRGRAANRIRLLVALAVFLLLWAVTAWAQDVESPDSWAAAKKRLSDAGIATKLQATDDLLGNATGGKTQGATLEGGVELSLEADLDKSLGLRGTTFKVNGYGVYGRGLSVRNIDNINLVSSIEALRSVWLYELWVQQATQDGRADLRVGQLGADTEFLVTKYGAWFVNTAFGWPSLPSVDLPSGGPAYPLATPGARLRLKPTDALTLFVAAFNGDPGGPGLNNPQRRDPDGTLFRVGDGAFAIAEMQYAIDHAAAPTTVKLGGWYHDKARPNEFYATEGLTSVSVASASSVASRDFSVYGIVDSMLLPNPDGKGGIAGFARASFAPPARSQVGFELAGGVVAEGPFDRAGDKAGLGVTTIRVGRPVGMTGLAAARYTLRGYETVVEASYIMQATSHLTLQPDAQFVAHPGGGIRNPEHPQQLIGSAAVIGMRVVLQF